MLEVYGSGYGLDTDKNGHKVRVKQTHALDAIQLLTMILDCMSSVISQTKELPIQPVFSGSNTFKASLLSALKFIEGGFRELREIQEQEQQRWLIQKEQREKETGTKYEEENNDFESIPQGHLVMVGCGHRGKPNRLEEKRISRLLRKSGFIPMLEALEYPPNPKH